MSKIAFPVVMLLLGLATPALPCSGVHVLPPGEVVESAQLIVRARAEGVAESRGTVDNVLAETSGQVRFRVLEVLKGGFGADEIVFNGTVEEEDDWNDGPVPYDFIRPGGRRGNCYALGYRVGAEYLLLLQETGASAVDVSRWSPYWAALAPTNEQVRGEGDAWVRWVRKASKRFP